jgi:TolB-like protein
MFTELKRRNVLRVAAAYVAVSWLLIQVVETLFPVFGLSDSAIRGVVIALAIGFVPVIVFAWAFELTPDGLVRDSEVDRSSATARASTRRLDRMAMVALALAVGYFAFDKFMLDPARDQAIAETAREEGRAEAVQQARDAGPPVLAVLPFSAVTDTEDSEFFAAGVHDDLLTKLAKLPSMLVISRTSVLEYKDTKENIRDIGAALGADAILEGGVQSAGNRIRINAQLIDAETDEHLWAETYDRELTTESIFDVQDDIARAITDALHITLSEPTRDNLIPTSSMAAYRAYHEAVIIRDASHGGITSTEYRELLQKAIELDPAFTQAVALLVGSYALQAFADQEPEPIAKVEAILEDLRAVAPGSADYLIAQTYYTYYILRDYDLALQIANQALALVPSDAYLIGITAWIKRRQGDFDGYIETMRLARQLEPRNIKWTGGIVNNLLYTHQYDAALAEIEAFDGRDLWLEWTRAELALGNHRDPQRLLGDVEALAEEFDDPNFRFVIWWARFIARDFAGAAEVLGALPGHPEGAAPPTTGLSDKLAVSIITYWALDDADRIAELVVEARKSIARLGTTEELLGTQAMMSVAMLAAIEGDTAETERLVQSWFQGIGQDWATRVLGRDKICQPLGMAGATEAAVKCIRDGLEEPSQIMPFLEPNLPFYDPIRNEPLFVELVEELAN